MTEMTMGMGINSLNLRNSINRYFLKHFSSIFMRFAVSNYLGNLVFLQIKGVEKPASNLN